MSCANAETQEARLRREEKEWYDRPKSQVCSVHAELQKERRSEQQRQRREESHLRSCREDFFMSEPRLPNQASPTKPVWRSAKLRKVARVRWKHCLSCRIRSVAENSTRWKKRKRRGTREKSDESDGKIGVVSDSTLRCSEEDNYVDEEKSGESEFVHSKSEETQANDEGFEVKMYLPVNMVINMVILLK